MARLIRFNPKTEYLASIKPAANFYQLMSLVYVDVKTSVQMTSDSVLRAT